MLSALTISIIFAKTIFRALVFIFSLHSKISSCLTITPILDLGLKVPIVYNVFKPTLNSVRLLSHLVTSPVK